MHFDLVVAADCKLGIGKNQTLPWKLPGDMAYFRDLTSGTNCCGKKNAVIMGRKTWQSIPAKFRPLPGRVNIVLTKDTGLEMPDGVLRCHDLDAALAQAERVGVERCFVIGGGTVYTESLKHPQLQRIYVTEIEESFDCDTFFPDYRSSFVQVSESPAKSENGISYSFKVYEKQP